MKQLIPKRCFQCRKFFQPDLNKRRFCSPKCFHDYNKPNPYLQKGSLNPRWKGGIHRRKIGSRRNQPYGYIEIWNGEKWIGEHRLKIEKKIGRKLLKSEHVHHKNGVRNDNRLKNLIVLPIGIHNSLEKPKQVPN